MIARLLLCAVLTALLVAPAASGQFQPLPPAPAPAPPAQPAQPAVSRDEGLSSREQLLLVFGALLLIAAIAFVIVRDARSAAPSRGRGIPPGDELDRQGTRSGSKPPASRRARQGRARAKRARQARKRNRPA